MLFLNLVPPTPFSKLEKGEKIHISREKSPLSNMERGFRGEVAFRINYETDHLGVGV